MQNSTTGPEEEPDNGKNQRGHGPVDSTDSELMQSRRELEEVRKELEACKRELIGKERAMAKLEEKLAQLQDANSLSKKEARLVRMASEMERAQEIATMGSWVLEVDTGEVTWTPELHRMFGQDASCPVPTLEQQKGWYSEASYNAMVEAVKRTSKDGSPYNIELEVKRRDGTNGVLRSIGEAERDESGRIVRLRGVAQDISEIKEAEAKLKHALEQEKAAQIYKDQFLANMSHELRTPLNGVVGFASLLREEGLDAQTREDYVRTIENCSGQLLNLINDIVDIAKIEAGEIKLDSRNFNLAKLTRETAATLEAIQAEKSKEHIQLKTYIPDGSENLEIYSDPLRIQQILINLLSNALKFSNEGTIEFGYDTGDRGVEFFVKDEGIGIAPERMELIFQRFEHLEGTTQKYEGTGLGLSISRGLAGLLGATLDVESELGVGSVFRLLLPLNPKTTTTKASVTTIPERKQGEPKAFTVLVAEDELVNQRLIKRTLRNTAYGLHFANNGEEAVQLYREHPEVSVILMDIRMPVMDGLEAAREILAHDPDARIIAQTAYAMREEREEFTRAGFVDYLAKPYRAEELIELIEKWA
ncbi:hypothetical protein DDZ13_03755 [Coraliomargarita sinensis]|uniref:histidine kinase n=1 Tax=Coraliomargarita sinensis TaxID=2174842 RepID=A0A317ZMP0_9BACT|nr:ATP-binding protein [Coraliomargarita sinensis]PXA05089.1 hypothetical protein DDZ13_03755 [Coraliomargarita sinensis]